MSEFKSIAIKSLKLLEEAMDILHDKNSEIAKLEKELLCFKDSKNWTDLYDSNGNLVSKGAVYIPKT